ncbi:hypothetical protein [Engelhardtia mirabilis]|uniref:Uncharacterized protein n=1 Tax=Engelhardtia mirabilis TaxID=2528011 RepID=A0A518BRC3_9BACT|nr:hypothetical protein Pla133_46360 [Planctomycetes bacterium Pla133]QDV03842.1 hypothetical protein Pla86_46340 [Planctomycetes bacterium Pla86]
MNTDAEPDDSRLNLYGDLIAHLEGEPTSAALETLRREAPLEFDRRLAHVRQVLAAAAQARLEPLPRASLDRAKALLADERGRGGWRTLVGKLVPPIADPQLALRQQVAGLRPYQALYTVDDYDVDLALDESGALIGQLMHRDGDELGAARAVLRGDDGRVAGTPLDALGCFVFDQLPAAPMELSIELGTTLIVLADVDPNR